MKFDKKHLVYQDNENVGNAARSVYLPDIEKPYRDELEVVQSVDALMLPNEQRLAESLGSPRPAARQDLDELK